MSASAVSAKRSSRSRSSLLKTMALPSASTSAEATSPSDYTTPATSLEVTPAPLADFATDEPRKPGSSIEIRLPSKGKSKANAEASSSKSTTRARPVRSTRGTIPDSDDSDDEFVKPMPVKHSLRNPYKKATEPAVKKGKSSAVIPDSEDDDLSGLDRDEIVARKLQEEEYRKAETRESPLSELSDTRLDSWNGISEPSELFDVKPLMLKGKADSKGLTSNGKDKAVTKTSKSKEKTETKSLKAKGRADADSQASKLPPSTFGRKRGRPSKASTASERRPSKKPKTKGYWSDDLSDSHADMDSESYDDDESMEEAPRVKRLIKKRKVPKRAPKVPAPQLPSDIDDELNRAYDTYDRAVPDPSSEEDSDLLTISSMDDSASDSRLTRAVRHATRNRRGFHTNTKMTRRAFVERGRLEANHPVLKTMWDDLKNKAPIAAGKAAQPQNISRQLKPFQSTLR